MKKIVLILALNGCASITPENRAKGYALEAADFRFKCKAYRFDRSAGLVGDVPTMTEACK
jgi:hypothetical protein